MPLTGQNGETANRKDESLCRMKHVLSKSIMQSSQRTKVHQLAKLKKINYKKYLYPFYLEKCIQK